MNNTQFQKTFTSLKEILKKHEKKLKLHIDKKDTYYLNAGYNEKTKTDYFFGAVMIKKNYVNYQVI